MNTSRLIVLGAGTAALALAACGSSSSSTASSSASSTGSSSSVVASSGSGAATQVDAAFAQQANAICADLNTQNKAVTNPGDPNLATADQLPTWSAYLDKVNGQTSAARSKLQALPPPSQGADGLATALGKAQTADQDAQAADTAAKAGDIAGFKTAITKLISDSSDTNAAFDAIGLKTCGSGS